MESAKYPARASARHLPSAGAADTLVVLAAGAVKKTQLGYGMLEKNWCREAD